MADLPEEAGHRSVTHGVVFLLLHLSLDVLGGLLLPLAEGKLQEVVRPPLLGRLLLEDVLEEVLIPLDEPLGVDLAMLDLFFSVPLNALEEGLEALLLLLSQLLHLLEEGQLEVLVLDLCLVHLLLLDHHPHRLCLVVVFDGKVDLLLLSHLDKVLASALFHDEVFRDLLLMKNELLFLLHLQLLDQLKRCALIVAHVLVPGIAELLELELLCAFNVYELLFLSQAHVLLLSLLLRSTELLKAHFHEFGLAIVAVGLCSYS